MGLIVMEKRLCPWTKPWRGWSSICPTGPTWFIMSVNVPVEKLGVLTTENIKEFFQALANHAGITIHIDLLRGENSHHIIEAVFKAFARAFRAAVSFEPNIEGVWSSKGKL